MHSIGLARAVLLLALVGAPLGAAAQSGDIRLSTEETLEYQLRMSVAPGTQQVYCYQQNQLLVVGSVNISSGTTAVVPVSLPNPVIRCAACNTWGCSSLSSNSAVVLARDRLDLNEDGKVNVSDMVSCVSQIQQQIY